MSIYIILYNQFTKMSNQKKNLILITWASSIIGAEFSKYYSYSDDNLVYTLWRRSIDSCHNTQHLIVDLLQNNQIQEILLPILESLKNNLIEQVCIIHWSGKSKNELLWVTPIVDINNDGMDDEMYDAQICTLDNLYVCVSDFFKNNQLYDTIKFTVVGMWSLIDKFNSPIHKSMREINNIMRDKLRRIANEESNHHTIMLSLSTVATETEKKYRQFADQTYWLSGTDVVDKSIDTINNRKNIYEDLPIYKYHPLYDSYFKHETIDQRIDRFKKEIGIV